MTKRHTTRNIQGNTSSYHCIECIKQPNETRKPGKRGGVYLLYVRTVMISQRDLMPIYGIARMIEFMYNHLGFFARFKMGCLRTYNHYCQE
ncbi:hypothetical protein I306_00510 [Cryptococcus gattii EJB2]|uniref:Uncharacterized protein n=1 Tax=Cryptococcus gattii EJB2 TaxID=1296103 RepID=A0ABR5C3B2_9TREE|nr:hypothetical protein I306_00510 [Cryptococcus gattii EJB2]